jgi:hypothetical protein
MTRAGQPRVALAGRAGLCPASCLLGPQTASSRFVFARPDTFLADWHDRLAPLRPKRQLIAGLERLSGKKVLLQESRLTNPPTGPGSAARRRKLPRPSLSTDFRCGADYLCVLGCGPAGPVAARPARGLDSWPNDLGDRRRRRRYGCLLGHAAAEEPDPWDSG